MLIALSGPDGSGKSTFARLLSAQIMQETPGVNVQFGWLRWNPRGQFHIGRKEAPCDRPVSTLDVNHKVSTQKALLKRCAGQRLTDAVSRELYRYQLGLQLGSFSGADIVVADRFTPDFCADQIGTDELSSARLQQLRGRLPVADIYYFLDCRDDVLVSRKHENESATALLHRATLYRRLRDMFGGVRVDTTCESSVRAALSNFTQVWEHAGASK